MSVIVADRPDVRDPGVLSLTAIHSSVAGSAAPGNELIDVGRDEIVALALQPRRIARRLLVDEQGVHMMIADASRVVELRIELIVVVPRGVVQQELDVAARLGADGLRSYDVVVAAPGIEDRHVIRQVEPLFECLQVALVVRHRRGQAADEGHAVIQAGRRVVLRPVPLVVP